MEEVIVTGTILTQKKFSIEKLYAVESFINEIVAKEVFNKYNCLVRVHIQRNQR